MENYITQKLDISNFEEIFNLRKKSSLFSNSFYTKKELDLMTDFETISRIKERLISEDFVFIWIRNNENKLIWFVQFQKSKKYINALFTDPDYFWKWIWKNLLKVAEKISLENNINEIFLNSRLSALDFYKKYWYEFIEDNIWEIEWNKILLAKMWKKLES